MDLREWKRQLVKVVDSALAFDIAFAAEGDAEYKNAVDSFRPMEREEVFQKIFETRLWRGVESASGGGSDASRTGRIVRELPKLFRAIGIKSILDIPCGDFNWMKRIDLSGIHYIGADIVAQLTMENQKYATTNREFVTLDLLTAKIPKVDLVLCRDALVHFPYADIKQAIENIRRSGSGYLLTTTFPRRAQNLDIHVGDWRPLNLQRRPFNFPNPLVTLNEDCPEYNGGYRDKSLGLWDLTN